MRQSEDRSWKNPQTYRLDANPTQDFVSTIALVSKIYSTLYLVITNTDNLKKWQVVKLNSLYKDLLKIFKNLLNTKLLDTIAEFAPELPFGIDDPVELYEIESWHWEDLQNFNIMLQKISSSEKIFIPSDIEDYIDQIIACVNDIDLSKSKVLLYENVLEYYAPSGQIYKMKYAKNSNEGKLIELLATQPDGIFTFEEIVAKFKKPKLSSDNPTNDKRVRSVVAQIRRKLKLPKNDNFLNADYGFGFKCSVESRH